MLGCFRLFLFSCGLCFVPGGKGNSLRKNDYLNFKDSPKDNRMDILSLECLSDVVAKFLTNATCYYT